MKRSSGIGYLLVLPAVLVFAAFVAYPLLHTILLSAYSYSPVNPVKIYRGLANFHDLFADPNFGVALRNNAYFIALSLLIQMPLALFLAIGLNSTLRRHHILRTVFFSPFVVPVVAVGLVWQLIYEPNIGALNALLQALGLDGLTTGWLGDRHIAIFAIIAVSCWRYTGFHMMILLAGLQAIPDELYEAAAIDGATGWQQFLHITLASLKRIILVDALLITVGSVKIFDLVQVMTAGGPGYASDVLATFMYKSAFTFDRMGYAAAIAVIMLVLTLLLTVAYIRLTRASQDAAEQLSQRPHTTWQLSALLAFILICTVVFGPRAVGKWVIFFAMLAAALLVIALLARLVSDAAERLPSLSVIIIRDTAMALAGLVFALPILWSLLSAVKPANELLFSPWALPQHWAWENFVAAWNSGVGLFFLNSVAVTAVAVLVMLVLAAPASYALARLRLRGEALIFGLILGGLLVPVHAALLPLYQLNNSLGLTDYAAIIGPYIAFCIPLSVLLLRAYFSGVPQELMDAAMMDGAGHLRILCSIFVPIARPALATVAIFQAAWVWNELLFALVFIANKAHMTLPVGLLTFQGEHSNNWAVIMAGVVMAIIPVLLLYFLFQRHVVKGLTAGAIK